MALQDAFDPFIKVLRKVHEVLRAVKKLLQAAEARRRYRSARPRTTGPCIEEVSRVKVGR